MEPGTPIALVEADEIVWRCWQDDVVVYQMRTGAVHHLEGVAAAVFAELAEAGPRSPATLAEWLSAAADLPVAQVQAPLAASLETLSRCHLIVPRPHP